MKILLVLLVSTVLGACATNQSRYQNTPVTKLCIDYLSLDDRATLGGAVVKGITGTSVREDMEMELKRRGEDCSNPTYLPAAQANAAAKRPIEVNVNVQQKQ